jgi:hypothetical protein
MSRTLFDDEPSDEQIRASIAADLDLELQRGRDRHALGTAAIELSPRDLARGRRHGARRASDYGSYAGRFKPTTSNLEVHTRGALAELAISKWLGLPWRNPYGVLDKRPDVGEDIEVRATFGHELIIRETDLRPPRDRRRYVAVQVLPRGAVLHGPLEFYVLGWTRPCDTSAWPMVDRGGRGLVARFVPADALRPADTLKEKP